MFRIVINVVTLSRFSDGSATRVAAPPERLVLSVDDDSLLANASIRSEDVGTAPLYAQLVFPNEIRKTAPVCVYLRISVLPRADSAGSAELGHSTSGQAAESPLVNVSLRVGFKEAAPVDTRPKVAVVINIADIGSALRLLRPVCF